MTESDVRLWSDYLGQVAGWTFGRLRAPVLARALEQRMSAHGITSYRDFRAFVSTREDAREVAHLIELLVDRQTSFFRNEPMLKAIADHVRPGLIEKARAGQTVNVLSAGCATGQELYSLALVLDESATEDERAKFTYRGADISHQCLAYARAGRYTRDELESLPRRHRGDLQAHIEASGLRYQMPEELLTRTTFVWSNLHTPDDAGPTYDLILCQNVLPSFHARAALQLVEHLCGRLSPGGYLFLGLDEVLDAAPAGVDIALFSQARAFRQP